MVEANPVRLNTEELAELEDWIFEPIDEEIRQFHDWCKDLVQEITQRILHLSIKHREISGRLQE